MDPPNHGSSVPKKHSTPRNRDVRLHIGQDGAQDIHLAGEAVDKGGLVAASDEPLLQRSPPLWRTGNSPWWVLASTTQTPVAEMTRCSMFARLERHQERSIFRSCKAIMCAAGEFLEGRCDGSVALYTLGPDAGAGGVVGEGEDQATEPGVAGADVGLASLRAAVELALR